MPTATPKIDQHQHPPITRIVRTRPGSYTSEQSKKSVTIQKSSFSTRKHSLWREKKVPRILAHYQIFSYLVYGTCIVIFIVYLAYIAVLLNTSLFYIQYEPVVKLFRYNSYSLVCPFLGILLCVRFIFHIKGRVKLEEGKYFGLVGLILFFSMMMCYDGMGVIHLYHDRQQYLANSSKPRFKESFNENETNALAWQYAWSTEPICARAHAHEMFLASEKSKKEHDADESHGPAYIETNEEMRRNPWMIQGVPKSKLAQGTKGRSNPETSEKDENKTLTVDQITYANVCNHTAFAVQKRPSRKWMIRMQKMYKCCGPYGYDDWKTHVTDIDTTCKGSKGGRHYKRSCAVPFSKFLAGRLHTTIGFMFSLVVVFLIIMFTSCCHFAAMKYEDTEIVQEYSLLDLTEPEDMPIVEIKRIKTAPKLIYSDAVRGILQSSTLRTHQGPGNFGTKPPMKPGHFKHISHTLMSTVGKKPTTNKGKGNVAGHTAGNKGNTAGNKV